MTKKNTMIEQGKRIRALREKLGFTRLQFHKKTGISASTLRSWEVGETSISPSKALTLSLILVFALGLPPEEAGRDVLLYGEKKKKRTPKATDQE